MNELLIFETEYWEVSHRQDSRLAGYLIASSKSNASEVHQLCSDSLAELGLILSESEKILRNAYRPHKVIMAKLGFSKGFQCHFHLIPATNDLLKEIASHPSYTDEPDGNDAILYISREYCERPLSLEEKSSLNKTVRQLKSTVNKFKYGTK